MDLSREEKQAIGQLIQVAWESGAIKGGAAAKVVLALEEKMQAALKVPPPVKEEQKP